MSAPTIPAGLTAGTQRITMRAAPCRCGCTGSDPWHRRTFTRTVRGVVALAAPVLSWEIDGAFAVHVVAVATITTPWGAQPVEMRRRTNFTGSESWAWVRKDMA